MKSLISKSALLILANAEANVGDEPSFKWMDKSLPPEERARALVAEMTFDEKVEMMHAHGFTNPYVGHTPACPRLKIPEFNYQDGP